jgi:hypothetical protein
MTLSEALELTALVSFKQPERFQLVAARWLERFVAETRPARLTDIVLVSALLQALGGDRHPQALTALRELARGSSRPPDQVGRGA